MHPRLKKFLIVRSHGRWGRKFFSFLAAKSTPGYKEKANLAFVHESGFISHLACIAQKKILYGKNVYVGDRVTMYGTSSGGEIELSDKVALYSDMIMETHEGGSIRIGDETHIQPRCHFVAAVNDIQIGKRCEIAPACAFYSFNHAMEAGVPVMDQGLTSKGGVVIGDDVWLGYGVVVLENVHIGNGAVVGANSLVTKDIPENAIAVGSPAKVVRYR